MLLPEPYGHWAFKVEGRVEKDCLLTLTCSARHFTPLVENSFHRARQVISVNEWTFSVGETIGFVGSEEIWRK